MSDEEAEKLIAEMGAGGVTSDGYHSFHDYLRCPKKHQYVKVRKIREPRSVIAPAFAVGIMVHAGRATWLGSQSSLDSDVIKAVHAAIDKAASETPLPTTPLVIKDAHRYMTEYIDYWSMRETPRTVATEMLVEHTWPGGRAAGPVKGTARLDDISFYPEAGKALCIGEAKTTSGSIESCVKKYKLHPQPMFQRILYSKAANGEACYGTVAGTILDVIQKGLGGKPCQFDRRFIPLSDKVLAAAEAYLVREKWAANELEWDDDVAAPRHFAHCTETIGMMLVTCAYQPLCMQGRDAALQFVTEDGQYLHKHVPAERKEVMPWE